MPIRCVFPKLRHQHLAPARILYLLISVVVMQVITAATQEMSALDDLHKSSGKHFYAWTFDFQKGSAPTRLSAFPSTTKGTSQAIIEMVGIAILETFAIVNPALRAIGWSRT